MKQLFLSFVFLASSSFSQDKSKPPILAHFMPWYQTPSVQGAWGWHWTMNHFNPEIIDQNGKREIASQYYPLTGPYDSKDRQVLEYQTLLMKISGIDGVLVDWYGMENFWDYGVLNESTRELFSAIQRARLSFGIVYEDQSVKHMVENGYISAGGALAYGKAVMKYLQDNWLGTNAYLKIGGRPVILTFGPQYFFASSDWDTLFSGLAVTPQLFTLDNRLAPVASGAYPWPPMWKSDASGILTQNALDDYLDQFYAQAANWPYLVTSAFPGFHDIYKEAGVGPSYGYLDPMDGGTFRSTLQKALAHSPDVIQIATWNDYGEGTIVEPTEQFGYQYLEIVQGIKDSLDSTFQFRNSDLQLPLRVYNARRQYVGVAGINSVLDRVFDLIISGQPAPALALMDSLSKTTYVPKGRGTPGEYFLGQNYPNPFNPATVISYQLPVTSFIKLQIFDLLGREVMALVNEEKEAGRYTVRWDAAKCASGLYVCRLVATASAGSGPVFVQTEKMILMK